MEVGAVRTVERQSWAAVLAVPTLQRGSDVAASPLREQQHPANTGRWSISSHGAGALGGFVALLSATGIL